MSAEILLLIETLPPPPVPSAGQAKDPLRPLDRDRRGNLAWTSRRSERLRIGRFRISSHFLWRPQLRDPNDEMVLDAAVNGGADCIATFNIADYLPAAARFGIAVERPGDILRRRQ
jgi:hypothetical protein